MKAQESNLANFKQRMSFCYGWIDALMDACMQAIFSYFGDSSLKMTKE